MKKNFLLMISALFVCANANAELIYTDRYDYYDKEHGLYLQREDQWGWDMSRLMVCSRGMVHDTETSHNWVDASYSGDVVIPEYVEDDYGNKMYIVGIQSGAFSGCKDLTSVTIGKAVETINPGAFSDCSAMKSITIPSTVKTIRNGAFSGCTAFEELIIPDGIEMDDNNAMFDGCTNLKRVKLPAGISVIGIYTFRNCSSLETFEVPETVDRIYTDAFYGCTALKSIKLPSALTKIPDNAFYECKSLTDVQMGSNITSVGSAAFMRCESLESIHLPDGVTECGLACFRECYKLRNFHFPASLTYLPSAMFSEDVSLSGTIVVPGNVKDIRSDAFSGTSLEKIVLEEGVETLSERVFHQCQSLVLAILPTTMTSVHGDAFQQCVNQYLQIYSYATTPPTVTSSYFMGGSDWKLFVPAESVDAYKASNWWRCDTYDYGTFSNIQGIYPMTDEMLGVTSVATEATEQGECYDLSGRRVANPTTSHQRGLYIRQGKKMLSL